MSQPNLLDAGPQDDTDYEAHISPDVIRTIIGEGDPAYVASVLRNRHNKSKINYETLINDPSQFEARTGSAWKQLSQISEDDPRYQKAIQVAGPILLGKTDPVTEADAFYSPTGQSAMGRAAPAWADANGVKGPDGQLYFTGKYVPPVRPNLMDAIATSSSADPTTPNAPIIPPVTTPGTASIAGKNGKIIFGDTGVNLPDEQSASVRALVDSGNYDITKSPGDAMFPWVQRNPTDTFKPGDFYIDPKGNMHRTPGGQNYNSTLGNFGSGLYAGAGDVPLSILRMIPGHQDSDFYNSFLGQQLEYNAQHEGSPAAQIGRFIGQIGASAPFMAGAGTATDALAGTRFLGPVGEFLGGQSPGWLRGLSLAARGSVLGGEQAALTSGASSDPLGQQIGTGATSGAVLGPLFHGIGSTVGSKLYPQISPIVSDLADKAVNKFGIDLRSPQIMGAVDANAANTDRRLLRAPGSGFAQNAAAQPLQFTQAVGSTFGVNPSEIPHGLTETALANAKQRIGNVMNSYAASQQVDGANLDDMISKLNQVKTDLRGALQKDQADPLVENIYKVIRQSRGGDFTGQNYKDFIANGQPFDHLQSHPDSVVKFYAGKVRDIIDDAFENSYDPKKGGVPLETFQQARSQYKNLMTAKDAVGSDGLIDPTALDNQVSKRFKDRAFSGAGDIGDLADIGNLFMGNNKHAVSPTSFLPALGAGVLGEGGALYLHNPTLAAQVAAGTAAALAGTRFAVNPARGAIANSFRDRLLNPLTYDPNTLLARSTNLFSVPITTQAVVNATQQPQGNR